MVVFKTFHFLQLYDDHLKKKISYFSQGSSSFPTWYFSLGQQSPYFFSKQQLDKWQVEQHQRPGIFVLSWKVNRTRVICCVTKLETKSSPSRSQTRQYCSLVSVNSQLCIHFLRAYYKTNCRVDLNQCCFDKKKTRKTCQKLFGPRHCPKNELKYSDIGYSNKW